MNQFKERETLPVIENPFTLSKVKQEGIEKTLEDKSLNPYEKKQRKEVPPSMEDRMKVEALLQIS